MIINFLIIIQGFMIKEKLLKLCLAPLRLLPIKENRIVFICNRGGGFCCNPKYMAQYIHENYGSQYEIIFFYNDESVVKRNNCDWITWKKFDGFGYIEAMATAKYIVSNITIPRFMPYKRHQVKMCTWHGSAFKGTGDMEYNFDKYDVFLAENELTYKVIREIWMYRGEILRTGMPRNDCLFNFTKKQIKNIKEKIGVPEEHLLLYAPTIRDKGDADCFSVDFLKLKAHLEDRFGGSWQVAFRYHPLQKKRNLPSGCIDLSTYEDKQELLMCTDILVTDYSSCMWDFSLMGKPCFVYASDIDRYINDERGAFLYPIDMLPFPLARNNDELVERIVQFNRKEYEERLEQFFKEWGRYNYDGTATEKAVDRLLNG